MDPLTLLVTALGVKLAYDVVGSWVQSDSAEPVTVEIKVGDKVVRVPEGASPEQIEKALKETLGDGRAASTGA